MTSTQRQPIDVSLPPWGVFVLESHHAPDFRMATQCHSFLELFYVLGGRGAFVIDGVAHRCAANDVVLIPAGRSHRIDDDPAGPLALYGICIAPEVWRHEAALVAGLPAGRLALAALQASQVRAYLRRLLFEQTLNRPGGRLQILALALQTLALLACAPPTRRTTDAGAGHRLAVERYVADLPTRFFEPADLDQTAADLGMSRRRFTHLFRQCTGDTWAVRLTRLRVEYACQLLRDTDRSVAAIAFECGFEDLSSFYRAFKRHTGLPPRAWQDGQAGR